jgi:hypothetical protein
MNVTSTAGWRALALVLGALAGVASAQGHGGGGPPPVIPAEAQQACSGLADGTACQFTVDGQAVTGTCRTGPQGEAAACFPPHRAPPPEAFQACSGLQEGEACTVAFRGTAMSGTCRSGPQGSALSCAPSGPPPQH